MQALPKTLSLVDFKGICDKDVMFKRALQCVERLQLHSLEISNSVCHENEFTATCRCSGTSASTFDISIKLNTTTKGIIFADCTCPYKAKSSKENDLCKHVIALLLKHFCHDFADHKKRTDFLQNEFKPKDPLHNKQMETKTGRKRMLPTWMKDHEKMDDKSSPACKVSKDFASGIGRRLERNPKKRGSYVKRTVYLMTPSEFLETAHGIIEEGLEKKSEISTLQANECGNTSAKIDDKSKIDARECKTQLDVCQHAELDERTFCNEAVETHFCETAKSKSSSPNFVEKQRTVHDKETRYSSNECADSNEYSLLDELI